MIEPAGRRIGRRDLAERAATTSANKPPITQPMVTEKGPPDDKCDRKVVMPPARMQMIENEIAKFENPLHAPVEFLRIAHGVEDFYVLVVMMCHSNPRCCGLSAFYVPRASMSAPPHAAGVSGSVSSAAFSAP